MTGDRTAKVWRQLSRTSHGMPVFAAQTITGRRAPKASRSSLVILLQLKFELLEYEMDRYDNVSFSGPLVSLVMTVQWY